MVIQNASIVTATGNIVADVCTQDSTHGIVELPSHKLIQVKHNGSVWLERREVKFSPTQALQTPPPPPPTRLQQTWLRAKTHRHKRLVGIAFLACLLFFAGIVSIVVTVEGQRPAQASVQTAPTSPTDISKKAQSLLSENIVHYVAVYNAGRLKLGSYPYASPQTQVRALSDSKSPASQFAQWHIDSQPMTDLSYQDAAMQAETLFTDGTPTQAIANWKSHMENAHVDLEKWAVLAAMWQGNAGVSRETVDSAGDTFLQDIAFAQSDLSTVWQGNN